MSSSNSKSGLSTIEDELHSLDHNPSYIAFWMWRCRYDPIVRSCYWYSWNSPLSAKIMDCAWHAHAHTHTVLHTHIRFCVRTSSEECSGQPPEKKTRTFVAKKQVRSIWWALSPPKNAPKQTLASEYSISPQSLKEASSGGSSSRTSELILEVAPVKPLHQDHPIPWSSPHVLIIKGVTREYTSH